MPLSGRPLSRCAGESLAREGVDQVHEFHRPLRAGWVDGGAVTLTPLDRLLCVAAPLGELRREPVRGSDLRGLTCVPEAVEAAEHREPDVRLVPLFLYAEDPLAPFANDSLDRGSKAAR